MKKYRAPSSKQSLDRILNKIYDDINDIGGVIGSEKKTSKASRVSDFRFVHDKGKGQYVMEAKFSDGWKRFVSEDSRKKSTTRVESTAPSESVIVESVTWDNVENKPTDQSGWAAETGFDNRYFRIGQNLSESESEIMRNNLGLGAQDDVVFASLATGVIIDDSPISFRDSEDNLQNVIVADPVEDNHAVTKAWADGQYMHSWSIHDGSGGPVYDVDPDSPTVNFLGKENTDTQSIYIQTNRISGGPSIEFGLNYDTLLNDLAGDNLTVSDFQLNAEGTDLGYVDKFNDGIEITSTTGSNVTIPLANASTGGFMGTNDWQKLDSIDEDADNYSNWRITGDNTGTGSVGSNQTVTFKGEKLTSVMRDGVEMTIETSWDIGDGGGQPVEVDGSQNVNFTGRENPATQEIYIDTELSGQSILFDLNLSALDDRFLQELTYITDSGDPSAPVKISISDGNEITLQEASSNNAGLLSASDYDFIQDLETDISDLEDAKVIGVSFNSNVRGLTINQEVGSVSTTLNNVAMENRENTFQDHQNFDTSISVNTASSTYDVNVGGDVNASGLRINGTPFHQRAYTWTDTQTFDGDVNFNGNVSGIDAGISDSDNVTWTGEHTFSQGILGTYFKSNENNSEWSQFSRTGSSSALYVNSESSSGTIARFSAGTLSANNGVVFSIEGDQTTTSNPILVNGNSVYHAGNKPSASDVGAVSTGGGSYSSNFTWTGEHEFTNDNGIEFTAHNGGRLWSHSNGLLYLRTDVSGGRTDIRMGTTMTFRVEGTDGLRIENDSSVTCYNGASVEGNPLIIDNNDSDHLRIIRSGLSSEWHIFASTDHIVGSTRALRIGHNDSTFLSINSDSEISAENWRIANWGSNSVEIVSTASIINTFNGSRWEVQDGSNTLFEVQSNEMTWNMGTIGIEWRERGSGSTQMNVNGTFGISFGGSNFDVRSNGSTVFRVSNNGVGEFSGGLILPDQPAT